MVLTAEHCVARLQHAHPCGIQQAAAGRVLDIRSERKWRVMLCICGCACARRCGACTSVSTGGGVVARWDLPHHQSDSHIASGWPQQEPLCELHPPAPRACNLHVAAHCCCQSTEFPSCWGSWEHEAASFRPACMECCWDIGCCVMQR